MYETLTMKKALTRNATPKSYWYWKDGENIFDSPPSVRGDLTGVYGDLTDVRGNLTAVSGDLTGVYGDLTAVSGDLTGVYGNLTSVSGDLTDCEITDEDRKKGIDINDLIG